MKLVLEVDPTELAALLADAVIVRLGRSTANSAELVGWRAAGVPATTWRAACRSGALPARRVGRAWLATREAVAGWLVGLEDKSPPRLAAEPSKLPPGEPSDALAELLDAGRLRVVRGGGRK